MRRQHWFLPILSLSALIACGANALADDGYDDYGDTNYREAVEYGPDVQGNFSTALKPERTPYYTSQDLNPPPGFDIAGWDPNAVPSHSAIATGANGGHDLPPQFGPYPQISPFEHAFQQHSVENGLWMQETRGHERNYKFGVEALMTTFRAPRDRRVGSTAVPTDNWQQGAAFVNSDLWNYVEPLKTRTVFDNWDSVGGIQVHWGYEDQDETGFEVTGFWTGEFEDTQTYGNLNADPNDIDQLSALNPSLPLDDGVGGDTSASITNGPYDRGVQYKYSQEAFGAQMNWIMSPFISRKNWQLQSLYGVRYLGIRERFSFQGRDSGANYTITFSNDPGTPPVLSGPFTPGTPYEGLLIATTASHLFGPEGGLRFEIGGDNLKIISTTKVGLLANRERTDVKGSGLGNGFSPLYDPNVQTSYKEVTTHVSPMLDFSLIAEADIFPIIPGLKKVKLLRDAKLRGGWEILSVWEVQRPTDAIVYQAPPENPYIKSDRTTWYAQTWHIGLVWEK